jgi:lysophospholipase L1-like esterase
VLVAVRSVYGALSVALSLLFGIVLIEGGLRLFPSLLPAEIRQLVQIRQHDFGVPHPYIGHLHRPHNSFIFTGRDFSATHRTDGHGFRNPWPWPERADIVALGDSVTFGQTVEDHQAWPAVLGRLLPQTRIVNLGLIGAGLQQSLRVYETFGIQLRPKVLLVGVFIRNDFSDDGLFERWLKSGWNKNYMVWRDFGRPKKLHFDPARPIRSLIAMLRQKLYLFARRTYFFNLLRYLKATIGEGRLSEVKIFRTADDSRLELLPRDFVDKTEGAAPERPEFQLVAKALRQIHATAARNGARTLVILQPSKEEIYLPLLGELASDRATPLQRLLTDYGIDYLDLTPEFRQRAIAGEKLFHEADGHPTDRGYALIAQLVASHLKINADVWAFTVKKQVS